jgi:PAS domain S-box-containing protein
MEWEKNRFAVHLIDHMADAVIYANAEGRIVYWNEGSERIFGFAQSEALGQSLDIIIPENLRQRHWEGYQETMRSGKSHYEAGALLAVPAIRKDGSRISIEFTVLPFHDESGQMAGIAAVLRDVSKQFQEMRKLRKDLALCQAQSQAIK